MFFWQSFRLDMSRPDSQIHDRHTSKVPLQGSIYLYEPRLTYKLNLQIPQCEFNATLITKLTSLYNLIILIQELI
jgi:hypothetical protein